MKISSFLFYVLEFVLSFSSDPISAAFLELFLSNSDLLGSNFQKLVISQVANRLLNWHYLWGNQNYLLVMGMRSDVGKFFLFGWVNFQVFLLVVLSNNQTVVNLLTCFNEQLSELLYFFQSIRCCLAIAHTDQGSLWILFQWTWVRLIFMEGCSDQSCSLGFVQ